MIKTAFAVLLVALAAAQPSPAQAEENGPGDRFSQVGTTVLRQLEESLEELSALRSRHAAEALALSKRLSGLEAELSAARKQSQEQSRSLERGTLDLVNLEAEIKAQGDELAYLANLFGEYLRNLESNLHICELAGMLEVLSAARSADEGGLDAERFQAYGKLLGSSIERTLEILGGRRFSGRAVDSHGSVLQGMFAQIGPVAVFRSADGACSGLAVARLGSPEPTIVEFHDPGHASAAALLVQEGQGSLPFDATGGNAHKIESTRESFIEHLEKGGPVMVPIGILAAAVLLVALWKWLALAFIGRPSPARIQALHSALETGRQEEAVQIARRLRGPIGRMIAEGVANLTESKELVEEAMYEVVIQAKMKLNRLLPFIAIAAAAAPLLGLLGTVTGIINTFKMITIFGSGDVKSLSGGISEALITTKFGLIVAIPALLLHAFLARKAKGIIGRMEMEAVGFMNRVVGRLDTGRRNGESGAWGQAGPDREIIRRQVNQAIKEALGPLARAEHEIPVEKSGELSR